MSKEQTARVTMWRELNIPAVYTMESSFCGASMGEFKDQHFQTEQLQACG